MERQLGGGGGGYVGYALKATLCFKRGHMMRFHVFLCLWSVTSCLCSVISKDATFKI